MTQTDKVTLTKVYEVVNRLEDKMDANLHDISKRVDDQDEEIAKVKEAQANARGFNTALGAVAGAAVSIIGSLIQRGSH